MSTAAIEVQPLDLPPHSIQAEQAILGGVMISQTGWHQIAGDVGADDFYRREHRVLFQVIAALAEKDEPLDPVTVGEELEHRELLDEVGGMPYLNALANDTPTAANVRAYARIVREHSVRRQLIKAGTEIADSGHRPNGLDLAQLIETAEGRLLDVADRHHRTTTGLVPVRSALVGAVDRIETAYQSDDPMTGLATGFADLDRLTAGLQPGSLIVVAGRPSMGKTALALNIAAHVAIHVRQAVAVFSLEMTTTDLSFRLLATLARLDLQRLFSGRLVDDEWPRLSQAVATLTDAKLFIDDTPALSAFQVHSRCERLQREHGRLGLIVIDYLGLMSGEGERQDLKVGALAQAAKRTAKEMDAPVLLVSQLNRGLENRPNKRPMLADLRDSGEIEQHADLVWFIYRDEVYNPDTADKGIAELNVSKHRNGPTGTVRLQFTPELTRFADLAKSWPDY